MSSLSALRSQLAALQAELAQTEKAREDAIEKRDKAKRRRDAVKDIKKDLESDFDNNCRSVNKAAVQMESDISKGLKGISNASVLDANVGADKEVNPDYEANLSTAHQALEDEYNDLERFYQEKKKEAEELKKKIISLKASIASTQSQIRAEEARLAREAYLRALLAQVKKD